MPSEITMPQLSDTMAEGAIVKWHKKEGDKVNAGEELADVETDKATMPMEAFESGTLAYIAAREGEKVKVGGVLGVIALPGEDVPQVKREAQAGKGAPAAAPHDEQEGSPEVERPFAQARGEQGGRQVAVGAATAAATAATGAPPAQPGEQIRVSPLARRIAADKGVDLSLITGSGPGGRIIERDVLEYVEKGGAAPAARPAAPAAPSRAGAAAAVPAPKPPAPIVLSGQKQLIPLTKMRSAIAAALQRSKQLIPHYYETIDIDVEELSALRQRLNAKLEKEGVRLSIADFVAKAVCSCLLKHPALNARFNAEKGEITQYGDVNLGIAVAIPDGLIVPVLRGANQLGLRDIRVRSLDLIERARAQRLRREEQSEATFTISSLGSYGIREFSAIINPPEVGILAVGSAQKRPTVVGNAVVPRTMLTVTLSSDHRVVDGATAAEFLTSLKEMLEEPGMLLV